MFQEIKNMRRWGKKENSDKLQFFTVTAILLVSTGNIRSLEGRNSDCSFSGLISALLKQSVKNYFW